MIKARLIWIYLTALVPFGVHFAPAAEPLSRIALHVAPPLPPPVVSRSAAPDGMGGGVAEVEALYSIGEPTDEEQLYLELINRARANPQAEAQILKNLTDPRVVSAYTYFNVDLNLMVTQFNSIAPAPPLSLSANLSTAARLHSQNMLEQDFQGHYGTDGSDPGARITRQGYSWMTYGENVYAYADSVAHGHAGFEVDWGGGVGGMQTPPGHRNSIHNATFREVGIGIVNGENGGLGPQLVTQDFATRFNSTPFVTGVVYYDLNANGFYDVGEGVGGVSVVVSNATLSAVTANSGGYSVPVSGNGTYVVRFTGPGLSSYQTSVTVSSGRNVKVDYAPVYAAPALSGPLQAAINRTNGYTFTAVGAAGGYEWQATRRVALNLLEGAEGGLGRMSAEASAGYAVVVNDIKATGASSFHLTHVQPAPQRLALSLVLRPTATSQVFFASRLGWAAPTEVARLQVSTNAGALWQDLWTRAGTSSAGQTSFGRVTNSLASYAGHEVTLRFVYDFNSGSYYPSSNAGVGWYIDDLSVSNSEELTEVQTTTVASGTTFNFSPTQLGSYSLRVRAQLGGRWLPWGPSFFIAAQASPSTVTIRGTPRFSGGRIQFDFDVSGVSTVQVQIASTPVGPWSTDSTASVQNLGGTSRRASAALGGNGPSYYRLVAH